MCGKEIIDWIGQADNRAVERLLPEIPPTAETVRKVEIKLPPGGRSLRARGNLSSHPCNLRKSVDESMVGFRYDSSTDYADYADEMKPEPTLDADPAYNSRHSFFSSRGEETEKTRSTRQRVVGWT